MAGWKNALSIGLCETNTGLSYQAGLGSAGLQTPASTNLLSPRLDYSVPSNSMYIATITGF